MFKKTFLSVVACVLSLVMVFAFTACGEPAATTTITLSETEITIGVGDNKRLTADVSDNSDVVWTTSDEAIATVTSGVVRGVAAGETTVTATANGVSASCTVTVQNIVVELDKTELTLDKERADEKTATLTATVKNGDTVLEGEQITWNSSNPAVATVENGVVTAVDEGEAVITAKRASGNASATCAVTVTWKDKPEGYAAIDYYEQNKVPVNTWGYWNDPAQYVGGISEMFSAAYQDSASSEAGKASFEFEVTSRSNVDLDASIIQITYRSAGEGGKLETGYYYTLTMDVTTNVAGEVQLNNERDGSGNQIGEANKFNLVEGKNTLTVTFPHHDDGVIHASGDYQNINSAVFLLLGKLEGRAKVEIDNVHWVKGEKAPDLEVPEPPAVNIPDLSAVAPIALDIRAENAATGEGNSGNEKYEITDNGEGMSYTVAYSGTWGTTYSHIVVAIPEAADAANNNTFSVKIKNNGEAAMTIRFDLAGVAYDNGTNLNSRDTALSAVATEGTPSVALDWDGTALTVAAGAEVTLYITYETESAAGVPTELLVYFDTVYEATPAEHSGNVTISEFKFATVAEAVPPAVNVPQVESTAIAAFSSTDGAYTATSADEGKSYNVTYTGVGGASYANISADITTLAANNNTFSVKIKNNGDAAVNLRIDICGTNTVTIGNNTASKDLNLDMVAIGGTGVRTDLEWDGSFITIGAGEEVTIVLTYENDNAGIGAPVELLFFIDSATYGDTNTYSGDVTFSEFKFANV